MLQLNRLIAAMVRLEARLIHGFALSCLNRLGPEAENLHNLARHAGWSPV